MRSKLAILALAGFVLAGRGYGETPSDDPRLREFRGKVVVLDVWATWCDSCVASLSYFDALRARYAARGLAVVGVNEDLEAKDLARYVRDHRIRYAVLADPKNRFPRDYGIRSLPAVFLIDPQGRVRSQWTELRPKDRRELETALDALLKP